MIFVHERHRQMKQLIGYFTANNGRSALIARQGQDRQRTMSGCATERRMRMGGPESTECEKFRFAGTRDV
ncbi:hypothetical protein C8258_20900 [Nocardia sp. MDA0666]|nr:hypothetical protein C8258_20900 [Nocardia sp. MDA0666]